MSQTKLQQLFHIPREYSVLHLGSLIARQRVSHFYDNSDSVALSKNYISTVHSLYQQPLEKSSTNPPWPSALAPGQNLSTNLPYPSLRHHVAYIYLHGTFHFLTCYLWSARLPRYKVELLSTGGFRIPPITVNASSPSQAKEAAVAQANANAQANVNTRAYEFRATNVTQI